MYGKHCTFVSCANKLTYLLTYDDVDDDGDTENNFYSVMFISSKDCR